MTLEEFNKWQVKQAGKLHSLLTSFECKDSRCKCILPNSDLGSLEANTHYKLALRNLVNCRDIARELPSIIESLNKVKIVVGELACNLGNKEANKETYQVRKIFKIKAKYDLQISSIEDQVTHSNLCAEWK